MLLYLLRHAEAGPYQADDFSRRLTEKGIAQAGRVGEFLGRQGLSPDLILSSPVLRAKETAEIVSTKLAKLGKPELLLAPWLACSMTPEIALHELADYKRLESVMIVGHEPDFSGLVATLLGAPFGEAINISKASLTIIDLARLTPGGGVLKLLLPVKLCE